ncbi:MAG: hypothetical protein QMC03_00095 [Flavobacteriales bacterium]
MKTLFRTLVLLIILFSACRKPDTFFQGSTTLRFSVDTLVFDTVFTTVGSITKRIKVYNDLDEDVRIDEIQLAKSGNSPYRLNIDGEQKDYANDVILRSKDSLHIFVEATIDPNDNNEPLIRTDSIIFSTNGKSQDIDLVAWGQDAHFYYNNSFFVFENEDPEVENDSLFFYSITESSTWNSDKPHVIYGNVIVHEGGSLTILAGSNVYLHHSANIIVLEESSLKILGAIENPVLIASDRLDEYYRDLPGQWGRIWLAGGSLDNQIKNATIKNGTIGLHVDTLASAFEPTLRLENTIIANNSSYGILAYSSNIEAFNCQISDNGTHDLYLFAGGSYRFSHCTFANYNSSHQAPSIRMSNFYEGVNGNEILRPMERADFENCIVYGRIQSELGIEETEETLFNYKFNNCLLKLKESDFDISNSSHFISNNYNENPDFVQEMDAYEYNYRLDSLSPALHSAAGNIALQFPYDLLGNSRLSDEGADIGAYERIE